MRTLVIVAVLAALCLMDVPLTGQEFAVASVKRNTSGDLQTRLLPQPGGVNFVNITVRQVIVRAYQIQDFQVIGGPGWLASDRFDINAKGDTVVPGLVPAMLKHLLADRFKLRVREEQRELPIFALVRAPQGNVLGAGLRAAREGCGPGVQQGSAQQACSAEIRPGRMSFQGGSIGQLVSALPQFLQRVVVDRTGLAGRFDIDLTWAADPPGSGATVRFGDGVDQPTGASLVTAVREQLGLRLEATRGQAPVLVIERVEPPSDN